MIESSPGQVAEACRRVIQAGQACLVLGSGASTDARLPQWRELAERFARGRNDPRTLLDESVQPVWAIECLRGDLGEADYRRSLRLALYGSDFQFENSHWRYIAVRYLARIAAHISTRNRDDLRFSDGNARREGGPSFQVLSYNLDCLMELAVQRSQYEARAIVPRIGGVLPYHEFEFGDRETPVDRSRVRVFHPHGLLPLDIAHYDDEGLLNCLPLVMSAEDYEARGGTVDVWQNAVQLAAFTHRSCVFYGFSFSDPSVRQLLRLSVLLRTRGIGFEPDIGHIAFLRSPPKGSAPSKSEWELALARFGFSHVFWGDRDAAFQDQVAMLEQLCRALDEEQELLSDEPT